MSNKPLRDVYSPPWGSIDHAARRRRLVRFLTRWTIRAAALAVFIVAGYLAL